MRLRLSGDGPHRLYRWPVFKQYRRVVVDYRHGDEGLGDGERYGRIRMAFNGSYESGI
jgi:hypothetical protein